MNNEYPKYMRKKGMRDLVVNNEEQEATARDDGYGHEVIVSDQRPPLGSTQPTPGPSSQNTPIGGAAAVSTVPSVPLSTLMDSLESAEQKRTALTEKFNESWALKCKEVDALTEQLKKANDDLFAANAKLKEFDKPVNAKPGPVKPPVAGKEE